MKDYKELVERLHKRIALTSAGSPLQEDLLEAANAIEELLSSVEVEATPIKRGRWIIKDDSYTYGIIRAVHWYECSNCGGIAYIEHPYCPNCGARMGEEE